MKTEQPRPNVPPLLLEGDDPAPASAAPQTGETERGTEELPGSYGSGELRVIARDPYSLYTHWDAAPESQRGKGTPSSHELLVVRVHAHPSGRPAGEVHLDPGSRHGFVPVEGAGQSYKVELGVYQPDGTWNSFATSSPVATPPDTASEDRSVQMASVGPEPDMAPTGAENEPTGDAATATLPDSGLAPTPESQTAWIPVLDSHSPEAHPVFPPVGDAEIPSGQPTAELPSNLQEALAGLAGLAPAPFEYPGISSPRGEAPWSGFRFDVNVELVVYGCTEPEARLTISGQPVALRPDGTFSHRLAFPDGSHQLAVSAVSSRGEWRQAELCFSRQTEYRSDPTLPSAEQAP